MEKFFAPGFRVRPKASPEPKRRVGRPPRAVPEGALELGERRERLSSSKKHFADKQRISVLEKEIELSKAMRSDVPESETTDVATLHH